MVTYFMRNIYKDQFVLKSQLQGLQQNALIQGNNLSDVQSASVARLNLGVYSKAEVDAVVASINTANFLRTDGTSFMTGSLNLAGQSLLNGNAGSFASLSVSNAGSFGSLSVTTPPTNLTDVVNLQYLNASILPIGSLIFLPTATLTDLGAFLVADGRVIPPQYTQLIAIYGTNLPDFRNKFVQGQATGSDMLATTGTSTVSLTGVNNGPHSHSITWGTAQYVGPAACVFLANSGSAGITSCAVNVPPSTNSDGSGTPFSNLPPNAKVGIYIYSGVVSAMRSSNLKNAFVDNANFLERQILTLEECDIDRIFYLNGNLHFRKKDEEFKLDLNSGDMKELINFPKEIINFIEENNVVVIMFDTKVASPYLDNVYQRIDDLFAVEKVLPLSIQDLIQDYLNNNKFDNLKSLLIERKKTVDPETIQNELLQEQNKELDELVFKFSFRKKSYSLNNLQINPYEAPPIMMEIATVVELLKNYPEETRTYELEIFGNFYGDVAIADLEELQIITKDFNFFWYERSLIYKKYRKKIGEALASLK